MPAVIYFIYLIIFQWYTEVGTQLGITGKKNFKKKTNGLCRVQMSSGQGIP
jgi:hypothetical protein